LPPANRGSYKSSVELEKWFHLSGRRTDVGTEVRAGLTTFMVMSYIIIVNPVILTTGATIAGLDVSFAAVVTSTCLVAGVITLVMGLWANMPFALAPGLGINAVVAFQLMVGQRYSFAESMAVILLEGLIITILVLTGLRQRVLHALPLALKLAIGAGIGLFIFAIGAYEAGLYVVPLGATQGGTIAPASLVNVPDFRYVGVGVPGLSFLGRGGAVALAGLLATLSLMLSDFFDTAGTFTALGAEAGLLDEHGNLREHEDRAFIVDSLGALSGGLIGSSSATTFIESAAGVAEGGRTGLASVVTAIPFFVAMWLANVFAIVPQEATAGALMVVGVLMLAAVGSEIPWKDFSVALPALFTVMLMPLTWSITNGIGAGVILYTVLHLRRAGLIMWVLSLAFALYFAFGTK
jgi:AGZA family xanthine/uracil permease-like MFS transporter